MSEESKEEDAPPQEPNVYLDGDISHLGAISIQLHEMYLQLKRSGFTSSQAIELAGMVLVAFSTPSYEYLDNDSEYYDTEEEEYEEDGNLLDFPEDDSTED